MHFLQLSYDCLHKDRFDQVHFQNVVFKFLPTYQWLGSLATEAYTWHLKPKFHLLAEIALAGDCPSLNWCYRDEEAGGSISNIGRSGGGQQTLELSQWRTVKRQESEVLRKEYLALYSRRWEPRLRGRRDAAAPATAATGLSTS